MKVKDLWGLIKTLKLFQLYRELIALLSHILLLLLTALFDLLLQFLQLF